MRSILPIAALVSLILADTAQAQSPRGGRVNGLKILSDQIEDVTTIENLLKSFIKPGMNDQERSKALWSAVVKYRHQTAPPDEKIGDLHAHDPIKVLNVYGYCQCCCTSALIEALNREDGREARGRILNGHSVPEVRYGKGWHMFDPALITYFPRPEDGVVASVDEIVKAVGDWYATHPGYRKNNQKIFELMRKDGWMAWKGEGPHLLADCPFYRMGYFPARTHGWDATMVEYDFKSDVYEYGYHVGHRALFSLRPGESFTREAGNRGLHVNMDAAPDWDGLKARAPENDLAYVDQFVPGYRGGVVGNGVHRYAPDLVSGDLALGSEVFDNLAIGAGSPSLRIKDAARPGVAVVPMISPYVYLGGKLRLKLAGKGGRVDVSISTNNGRTFTPINSITVDGPTEAVVDLKDKVLRRYAYWLKFELTGGAGLDALAIENDFQHAPRTLPRLAKGRTTVTVALDGDPTIATRSIAPKITPASDFVANESSRSMGLTFENLRLEHDACWWKGGTGVMTVPVETPGDLVSLGFSAMVRVRGEKDRVRVVASTDDGRTWREVAVLAGPTQGRTGHFRVASWPPHTRKALLRFELTGNNTVGVQALRIDADHRDPLASSTPRPFHVVHRWTDSGKPRTHDQTITRLPASYTIDSLGEPEMVSVTYEMPTGR